MCDSCNSIYYGKTLRHFKVRVSEHLGVSAKTEKRVKVFNTTAVRDRSLFCKEARSDNFEILCYESNNFKLCLKESLFIHKDDPPLNKTIKSMPLELFNDT